MFNPFFEAIKSCTFRSEFFWESGPLAASAGEVDDAVEDGSVWLTWTTWFLSGFVDDEFWFDALPEFI